MMADCQFCFTEGRRGAQADELLARELAGQDGGAAAAASPATDDWARRQQVPSCSCRHAMAIAGIQI